ncbi:GGDEF-domain containing protein [Aureimonas sp. SA4125]|uniref:putative bifunctional diguanylate cyclase/phosphodiesterase n=1 Tax=Aureimonas sp. SA4125 TaxID=2826993 RepID=UPI001CC7B855|nr:EAL domain-containing protein [Aureimonas sp. SA4125]BDA87017.1 GGDEF-domain containing protein [Aureimonas sp. SA4125]
MNRPLASLVALLGLDFSDRNLAMAQAVALQRQIPLMYALLVVNAGALSYTHLAFAPWWLTVAVPSVLLVVCVIRALTWFRQRHQTIEADAAVFQLQRTVMLAAVISIAFVSWALALDSYGGPLERGHVALFIAITVIGCIFCLMPLPQAALIVTATVTVPYLIHYLAEGDTVFLAIALDIALVTAVMIKVLLNSFSGFAQLIHSRADLASKQAEAERLSEENARLAHTDSLTGLPNRRHFFALIDTLIETSRETGGRFALGTLDLDRFKPVNDTYGHVAGDRILSAVGERLTAACGPDVTVSRLGGDEFGFTVIGDLARAQSVGQHLCDILGEPFDLDECRIKLGCSGGMAMFPEAGLTRQALFDRCDYALYYAKSKHPGRAMLFSLEHETKIRSDREIEAVLLAADFAAEMEIHFQPIVDSATRIPVAVEALARWTSPVLGRVPPDQFIAVAERLGCIHRLTLTLFGKALAKVSQLPPEIGLSFNLSARDITSPETVLSLIASIRHSGIDPKRISLELTETAVMRDFDAARRAIGLLQALGVSIALDDFGTGYSSLGYLHRLAFDKVKLDRSFIGDLGSPSGRNIVGAMIALCGTLNLECIVEGVENEEQLAQLRLLGCTLVQGYLMGRPMPLGELTPWFAAGPQSADRHRAG